MTRRGRAALRRAAALRQARARPLIVPARATLRVQRASWLEWLWGASGFSPLAPVSAQVPARPSPPR